MEQHVRELLTTHASLSHGEFEIRLGTFRDDVFHVGVTKETFDELERDLRDSSLVEHEWCEVVDYHYVTDDNTNVRTRVWYDTKNIDVKTEHVCKTCVSNVVVRSPHDSLEAVRIAVSDETPHPDVPGICMPVHVRVRQRKTFVDVRDGETLFSYDMSKTWSGNSRTAVENMQHVAEPVYEIECEYRGTATSDGIASSICNKARGLMGLPTDAALEVAKMPKKRRKRKTPNQN